MRVLPLTEGHFGYCTGADDVSRIRFFSLRDISVEMGHSISPKYKKNETRFKEDQQGRKETFCEMLMKMQ